MRCWRGRHRNRPSPGREVILVQASTEAQVYESEERSRQQRIMLSSLISNCSDAQLALNGPGLPPAQHVLYGSSRTSLEWQGSGVSVDRVPMMTRLDCQHQDSLALAVTCRQQHRMISMPGCIRAAITYASLTVCFLALFMCASACMSDLPNHGFRLANIIFFLIAPDVLPRAAPCAAVYFRLPRFFVVTVIFFFLSHSCQIITLPQSLPLSSSPTSSPSTFSFARRFPCRLRLSDPSAWRVVGLLGHEQIRFPWEFGTSP